MATQVYSTLAKIVGAVLVLVGVAALFGANFAHGFVSQRLSDQGHHHADRRGHRWRGQGTAMSPRLTARLCVRSWVKMSTSPMARAFADHYILPT